MQISVFNVGRFVRAIPAELCRDNVFEVTRSALVNVDFHCLLPGTDKIGNLEALNGKKGHKHSFIMCTT
jgi:hypothetical protein